jgi:hypothetical protein
MTYLDQTPGGHLIYDVRQRHISVIVFQERSFSGTCRSVIALRTDFPHQSNFSPQGQSGALLTPELAGINQATQEIRELANLVVPADVAISSYLARAIVDPAGRELLACRS